MSTDQLIDFATGEPDPTAMHLAEIRWPAFQRLSLPDTSYFPYAPEQGSTELREQLAPWLSRRSGCPVNASNLLITAGASHALDLILSRFCAPGDTVFVEDPTYFLALNVLTGRNVNLVALPIDEGGLKVDVLEARLRTDIPRLLYLIPTFHNPTGVTLSEDRRKRIVELAQHFNFLVLADEVYQMIGNPAATPPPFRTVNQSHVISLGSFSKILGPGVRLGWIECDQHKTDILTGCGVLRSGGGVAPLMSAIIANVIDTGLQDRYLDNACTIYTARREFMIECLSKMLPEDVRFIQPQGGFYVWLELPVGIDTVALAEMALSAGVTFRPGPVFSCDRQFTNCLRLCFTLNSEKNIAVGVERLADLIRVHTQGIGDYKRVIGAIS